MSELAIAPTVGQAEPSITYSRRRLYGLCLVLALAVWVMCSYTSGSESWVEIYLPLTGATMLMLGLAGSEFHLHLLRNAQEHRAHLLEQAHAEETALERQRTFNRIWQELADARGDTCVPGTVMKDLSDLFASDLVVVWAADVINGGFQLRGVHPAVNEMTGRLEKIGRASPCFERLRTKQRVMRVTDFDRQTATAFGWFCEENGLQQAVLSPVMVRHELVGVLVFFYREKPAISTKLAEEMQAAANLFLCAL